MFRHEEWIEHEAELNSQVICDRPRDFQDCKSTFECLVKLKHYNQPSRLLDLTSNPLVALYFACECMKSNNSISPGVVVEAYSNVDKEKIAGISDTVTLLSSITKTKQVDVKKRNNDEYLRQEQYFPEQSCKLIPNDSNNKSAKFANHYNSDFINELKHQCKKESGSELNWDTLDYEELNQSVLVRPPLNNDRIIQQQGCFIMCGCNPFDNSLPPDDLFKFFKQDNGKWSYYYILPDDVDSILEDLKVLGINKYYIYPDLEKDIEVNKIERLKVNEVSDRK